MAGTIPWLAMPGMAFLYPLPDNKHLQVVILVQENTCLIAPLCTARNQHSLIECPLSSSDHSYITHESFMDFSFTAEVSESVVREWMASGKACYKEPFSKDVCDYIVQCASNSRTMPKKFRKLFK